MTVAAGDSGEGSWLCMYIGMASELMEVILIFSSCSTQKVDIDQKL